jgi:hypothetical protein
MLTELQSPRALVKNATDPKQQKYAERLLKRRHARLVDALRAVMGTPAGRIVFWELIVTCRSFESIYRNGAGDLLYNAGRQDVGFELLRDLQDCTPDLYLLMEQEMRALATREASETDAVQVTPREPEEQE